jgi:hypothetical protein
VVRASAKILYACFASRIRRFNDLFASCTRTISAEAPDLQIVLNALRVSGRLTVAKGRNRTTDTRIFSPLSLVLGA